MQHYCGRLRQENIIAQVEGDLHSILYSEEKVNFNFETYVSIHRNVFNEMDKSKDCPSPDGCTRVRQLLANITTRDPALAAPIASVRASPSLRVYLKTQSTSYVKLYATMDETITPRVGSQPCNAAKKIPEINVIETTTTVKKKKHKGGKPWKKI